MPHRIALLGSATNRRFTCSSVQNVHLIARSSPYSLGFNDPQAFFAVQLYKNIRTVSAYMQNTVHLKHVSTSFRISALLSAFKAYSLYHQVTAHYSFRSSLSLTFALMGGGLKPHLPLIAKKRRPACHFFAYLLRHPQNIS